MQLRDRLTEGIDIPNLEKSPFKLRSVLFEMPINTKSATTAKLKDRKRMVENVPQRRIIGSNAKETMMTLLKQNNLRERIPLDSMGGLMKQVNKYKYTMNLGRSTIDHMKLDSHLRYSGCGI